jgi:hypothetical protein
MSTVNGLTYQAWLLAAFDGATTVAELVRVDALTGWIRGEDPADWRRQWVNCRECKGALVLRDNDYTVCDHCDRRLSDEESVREAGTRKYRDDGWHR